MNAEFVVAYRPVTGPGSADPPRLAKTRTVGLGGTMFESEDALTNGEQFSIELMVEERTVKARGRVVYVERQPNGFYQNGIEFTDISDDDRDFLLTCYLQREYRISPDE
jgi:hypothetical protein